VNFFSRNTRRKRFFFVKGIGRFRKEAVWHTQRKAERHDRGFSLHHHSVTISYRAAFKKKAVQQRGDLRCRRRLSEGTAGGNDQAVLERGGLDKKKKVRSSSVISEHRGETHVRAENIITDGEDGPLRPGRRPDERKKIFFFVDGRKGGRSRGSMRRERRLMNTEGIKERLSPSRERGGHVCLKWEGRKGCDWGRNSSDLRE